MKTDYEKFSDYVDARGIGTPAPAPAPLSMNAFIRQASGRPATAAAVVPKPASVNGGEGSGASSPAKPSMNNYLRAAKYGTPLW